MLATVEEMLERVGVDADGVVVEELPHNRWSPGYGGSVPVQGGWRC